MSSGRLDGKVALVSGGGSRSEGVGTGRAAAVLFAREGARVAVIDRSLEAAEFTAELIRAEGGQAMALAADSTSHADCESVIERVLAAWQGIDVLDNNVGGNGRGTVLTADDQMWDHVLRLNILTTVTMSRAVIPAMAAAGGGSIINVSSIAAFRPRGITPYTAAKAAVIALSQSMAVDHGPQGVRVNCIAPGPIYTPMVAADSMAADVRERRRLASPLAIEGTAWDVAHAAVYLASDEARYVSGIVLPVDGAVSLTSPDRSPRIDEGSVAT